MKKNLSKFPRRMLAKKKGSIISKDRDNSDLCKPDKLQYIPLLTSLCKVLSAKLTHDTSFQPDRMSFRAHRDAESVPQSTASR